LAKDLVYFPQCLSNRLRRCFHRARDIPRHGSLERHDLLSPGDSADAWARVIDERLRWREAGWGNRIFTRIDTDSFPL